MKKYLLLCLVLSLLASGTAFAKSKNDPFTKIWEAISELEEKVEHQKLVTYIKTANANFLDDLKDSEIVIHCNDGDTALSGGINGDMYELNSMTPYYSFPIINDAGKSIGWKFRGKINDGDGASYQMYVTCLES